MTRLPNLTALRRRWRRVTIRIPFLPDHDEPIRVRLTDGVIVAVAIVLVAAVLGLTTDIGEHADISFYGTLAQVIPVFLLALVVEIRDRLGRSAEYATAALATATAEHNELERRVRLLPQHDPAIAEIDDVLTKRDAELSAARLELRDALSITQQVVRGYVIAALPGEAACLAALAAGKGSTFYLTLGLLSLFTMVLLYVRRAGLHPALDVRQVDLAPSRTSR